MPEVIEHSNADIYAIVRIEDPDEGRHGKVDSLEIVDGDAEAHFRIRQPSIDEPNEFNIEVLRLLDREISPYGYNLTLKVKKFLKVILNFVQLNEFQCSQNLHVVTNDLLLWKNGRKYEAIWYHYLFSCKHEKNKYKNVT